ncbi:MAG: ruvA [Ilumatobacteraceae bacterium]|nr:ruvA [Ilumatobacteraceae bacterium]
MIGSLRGSVLERNTDSEVLLEVGGVGYLVTVTPRTLAELEPGASVFLHVHHHIREDAQTLFGFLRREERTTFQVLVATHGVGPALAMSILATHTPVALVDIVAGSDVASLTLVPGVGKKTAERLLIELKSRLNLPILDPVGASLARESSGGSALADVREALYGLGYGPEEVRDTLRDMQGGRDAATMLREALQLLGARRA